MSDQTFQNRIEATARQIETGLDGLLGPALLPGEIARPPRLLAAMRYATLEGGKRLRPFLTIETAALFGVSGAGALRAACALEMVHCYSLVHDDLPAMDNDDLRRGRATVHRAYDEATAILAGDALLTYAFDVMADEATHPGAGIRAALVLGLARAAGLGGMAGGQMLDLQAETATAPLSPGEIEILQGMKTGALLHFAVEAGAILGGASTADRTALTGYGQMLGAAFQITDDILDAEGEAARLGKAAAKDAARNKATFVTALGLDQAKALRDKCMERAATALSPFGQRADILRSAAAFAAGRDH